MLESGLLVVNTFNTLRDGLRTKAGDPIPIYLSKEKEIEISGRVHRSNESRIDAVGNPGDSNPGRSGCRNTGDKRDCDDGH